jgi:glycosyltransferase involved in cell wall biosynthesis
MKSLDQNYEIIMVDDGSSDKTLPILRSLQGKDDHLRVIKFRGNFGQSAAMAAGFDAARGESVIAMDGDLQNDPHDIPRLLEKLDQGYDVVSGWRKHRKDKLLLRKIPSKIANRLICSVTGVRLHDTGCSLKAFRKVIIKKVKLYGELHRFIPALAKLEGAKITEIAVNHRARKFGVSKYNISRTFRVIMDLTTLNLFIKHLRNPLRFFGSLALVSMLIASFMMLWAGVMWANNNYEISSFNIVLTMVFLFVVTTVHTGKKKSFYLLDSQTN